LSKGGLHIRPAHHGDAQAWATLRARLWPEADPVELAAECATFLDGNAIPTIAAVFLAEEEAKAVGFLELALRSFADGCLSMPVPHVEGWYVEPFARGRGVGRALMQTAEDWARQHGFAELGSDTEPWNDASLAAHARCGFEETGRLVKLRKLLT
jgi:aminoglycoside 6'-N-acetyltransferase I